MSPVYPTETLACFVREDAVVVAYVVVASFGKTAATVPRLPLPACPTCREIWDPSLGAYTHSQPPLNKYNNKD